MSASHHPDHSNTTTPHFPTEQEINAIAGINEVERRELGRIRLEVARWAEEIETVVLRTEEWTQRLHESADGALDILAVILTVSWLTGLRRHWALELAGLLGVASNLHDQWRVRAKRYPQIIKDELGRLTKELQTEVVKLERLAEAHEENESLKKVLKEMRAELVRLSDLGKLETVWIDRNVLTSLGQRRIYGIEEGEFRRKAREAGMFLPHEWQT